MWFVGLVVASFLAAWLPRQEKPVPLTPYGIRMAQQDSLIRKDSLARDSAARNDR